MRNDYSVLGELGAHVESIGTVDPRSEWLVSYEQLLMRYRVSVLVLFPSSPNDCFSLTTVWQSIWLIMRAEQGKRDFFSCNQLRDKSICSSGVTTDFQLLCQILKTSYNFVIVANSRSRMILIRCLKEYIILCLVSFLYLLSFSNMYTILIFNLV